MYDFYSPFKLNDIPDTSGMSKDSMIASKKQINDLLKQAKTQAKQNTCYICKKQSTSFCNSHTIPQFCLRNIAKDGKVYCLNAILELPLLKEDKGINESGTFHLICRDCDSKVFSDYENPDNYNNKLTTKMLAQMEIKNNLKNISKRLIELHLYDLMLGIGVPDYWVELKKRVSDMDLKEYNACFENGLKRNKKPFEGDYYVPIHIELPYTIPIAFQGAIALFNDLGGNPINEVHNLDPKYVIESVYLSVLPLKDKSVIIMFIKNGVKRYSRFFKQMNKLTEAEQLSVLNYIVFAYCEDYFISPDISKDSLEKFIQIAGQTTDGLLTSDHQPNLDEVFDKISPIYNYDDRQNIPNLFLEEYKIIR